MNLAFFVKFEIESIVKIFAPHHRPFGKGYGDALISELTQYVYLTICARIFPQSAKEPSSVYSSVVRHSGVPVCFLEKFLARPMAPQSVSLISTVMPPAVCFEPFGKFLMIYVLMSAPVPNNFFVASSDDALTTIVSPGSIFFLFVSVPLSE